MWEQFYFEHDTDTSENIFLSICLVDKNIFNFCEVFDLMKVGKTIAFGHRSKKKTFWKSLIMSLYQISPLVFHLVKELTQKVVIYTKDEIRNRCIVLRRDSLTKIALQSFSHRKNRSFCKLSKRSVFRPIYQWQLQRFEIIFQTFLPVNTLYRTRPTSTRKLVLYGRIKKKCSGWARYSFIFS